MEHTGSSTDQVQHTASEAAAEVPTRSAWATLLPRCASDALAVAFLASPEVRGLSINTVLAYGRAVESLIEMAGDLGTLRLDRPATHRYLAHRARTTSRHRASRGSCLARATLKQRIVGLRAYADYLIDCGLLDRNPVARGGVRRTPEGEAIPIRRGLVPTSRQVPRLPTDEQWARLLSALRARPARDQLMFVLAYDGALRRAPVPTNNHLSECLRDFPEAENLTILSDNQNEDLLKERQISEDDALALCQRAEGYFFDRKAAAISGQKLQKIVVAFANADGGEVVIGIADDKDEPDPTKRWGGNKTIEDFNGLLQAIHQLNPSVDARYEFLRSTAKDTLILHVFLERSADVNMTTDGKVYQRTGAQSLPLTADQITQLGFAKGARSYENMKLPDLNPEQISDAAELASFLADYSPSTDPLNYVVNQHLVETKDWTPLMAGILLFGDNPSAMLPRKCGVRISRYETREDDPERDHLKESYYIEGPAYRLIHDSVDKITSILSGISMWTSQQTDKKGYPPEAIWEVFVNAIVHRDYSISDDVHVTIFNDRIEIASPGRLPGYVRVDNILDARFSRNSKLVRCLNRYRDAPNKDMGEGLNTAFQRMKEWKLKPPVIEEDGNYIKVTIRHAPLALPTEAIMSFLEDHSEITNAQTRQLTGIKSENAVKKEFYKLRDSGIIERVPNKGGGHAAWRKVVPSTLAS